MTDEHDKPNKAKCELAAAVDEKCNALIAGNAHFVRAEKAEADARSWRDQASDRLKDWDEMRVAKEKAEAALADLQKRLDKLNLRLDEEPAANSTINVCQIREILK